MSVDPTVLESHLKKLEQIGLVCTISSCYSVATAKQRSNTSTWNAERVLKFVREGSTVIGRGGAGIVYANDRIDPDVVIKVSKSQTTCASFGTDFKIASEIHRQMREFQYENRLANVVQVIAEFPDISIEPGFKHCALVMQRVHRPLLLPEPESTLAYQAYLGNDSIVRSVPGRGIYIGVEQIAPTIAPDTVEQLAEAMGSLVGFLHYGAMSDATDMEYLLGYTDSATRAIGVVAIDFDRVGFFTPEQIESESAEVVERFYWSLDQEEYFPKPDSPLYDVFRDAYLREGTRFGFESLAQKVLDRYEQ